MVEIENESIENPFTILLKYYYFFKTPFGLQRIKLVRGKITYPGKVYKIYSIILLFITCAAATISLRIMFSPNNSKISLPLLISSIIYVIGVTIGFLTLFIVGLCFSNKNYGKMFNLLLKTAHELNYGCAKQCRNFKIILIFVHGLILFVKLFFAIPDFLYHKSWSTFSGHFMIFVNDLEIMDFIIEINLVAKLFENLNNKLMFFSKNKLNTKNGLLNKIWRSKSKIDIYADRKTLFKMIQCYFNLFDVIDSLNQSYNVLVNTCIFIFIKIQICL